MLLSVQNNLDLLPTTQFSYITSNITSGGTAIPVRNLNAFTNQYAVQIGKTGQEQSEIKIINTPSGTILPLNGGGTLLYDHPLDTPVFNIHYDKIIFLRSTAGTSGTATGLATVSITPDSIYTEYNDSSGASTYAYKTQFYNSVSGDISAESDWFTPAGPSFYSLGKLRDRGRKVLYNSSYITDDTVIDDWINEWAEDLNNAAIKVNKGYSIGTAQYAFGTNGYGTITEAGFKMANKIEVTWDGVNWTPTSEIPLSQYSDYSAASSIWPRHSWEGDTVFRVLPYGAAGTARFSFSKLNTILVDDTDDLPVPFRGYTRGCIEYIQYRALGKDSKDPESNPHYARHLEIKNNFISEMTPRDQTGVKYINLIEGLSGLNDDVTLGSDYF